TGLVQVPLVLRGVRVGPDHLAGGCVTGDGGGAVLRGVLFEAGGEGRITTVVGVPGRAVRGSVEEEVVHFVVGEVTPDGTAAELPAVAVPGVNTGFGPLAVDL